MMIGIAVVFGGASLFAAELWLKSQASSVPEPVVMPAEPSVQFETIVVANSPLRFGMPLQRSELSEIPWPQKTLPAGAFSTIDQVIASGVRVVLSPIERNEPVLLAKLSGPDGRATLSNLLTPGMRAVTVSTDEIAGVGGFIAPGDRIDVVLTRDRGMPNDEAGTRPSAPGATITAQVVVENARVLTVGQDADERHTSPQVANSVTIEVTTEDAQKIALARTIGSLSLSLRAVAEEGASGGGITTISAFGDSFSTKIGEAAGKLFGGLSEPQGPKYRTVIVTRGMEPQSYQVVSPEQEKKKKQE
jgi:pilus assembly protein CpaB